MKYYQHLKEAGTFSTIHDATIKFIDEMPFNECISLTALIKDHIRLKYFISFVLHYEIKGYWFDKGLSIGFKDNFLSIEKNDISTTIKRHENSKRSL